MSMSSCMTCRKARRPINRHKTIRIIRSNPHGFGCQATPLVNEMMTRAADAIRRNDYAHAFDLFDLLVEKARNLRAH